MEVTSGTSAEASPVAVRLPPFSAEQPAVWFAQAEAQFHLAGIRDEATKFYHVIAQLDHQIAAEVEDIITSPPQQEPYTRLKTELVNRLFPLREQRARQPLTHQEMGDRTPSQFLRHLRNLAPDVPDSILRSIWSRRLPHNVQAILASQREGDLNTAARYADRIIEASPTQTFANFASTTDSTALLQRIDDLSRQIAAFIAERNRSRSGDNRYRPRDCSPEKSNSRDDTAITRCWYHRRFGASAQNCTKPCSYSQQGKLPHQTSTAVYVYTTTTRRLYVTDKRSKQQFLINTGSDLCVFPRKLIPQRKESVNFDIRAANGTTIRTYGWLTLKLNLGLRRDFTWRFVVADVMYPLIGADFLSHFGLLVDCRNKRLVDGTTSLSAPIQATSSPIPSVKVSSGGTPMDSRPSRCSASQQTAPPAHSPPETSSDSSPSQSSYISAKGPPQMHTRLTPLGRNALGSGASSLRDLPGPASERKKAKTPRAWKTCHCHHR
jgi:hypothetical protein